MQRNDYIVSTLLPILAQTIVVLSDVVNQTSAASANTADALTDTVRLLRIAIAHIPTGE